ncbi:Membrane-associated tyrosine-and threonine-specific cdc2-inhibitory kinase (Myt1 kinase) [Ectocarpus siliculosus]|uniref:Membrane-associated tyrosine-and threonine-specific cdc2-inhibitory kinase (Myt1 kinase) n=1 Tax=Ectocarpus siliculosus TaxID=2880 RepID=D7FL13_ECTSI|nr:Membrane-associated tyrosine-and threonine-specific cdc2-inhibitory kinase (Myt1 kinase) [Ectocarpus siliculosus]|eukprot:CBJ29556.1 Membrane-associated tyrosine-and threonine-specific cdc2-inhibitory kinase (Myt1 kinase) [Ectocarpus siliculosus]
MRIWRRKAASGDDNSQTGERRQWFSFGAMKKAKELEKDNEAPATAKVAAATSGHPRWRLGGLRPMSGVMVLPYRSWHTTGWRRQLPEDRIAPADTNKKRTQAPLLRKNAEVSIRGERRVYLPMASQTTAEEKKGRIKPRWACYRYFTVVSIRGGRRVYLPTSSETTAEEKNGGGKPRWACCRHLTMVSIRGGRRVYLPTSSETTAEEKKGGGKPRWACCRHLTMVRSGGVHRGGEACLPADAIGDNRGEGGRQAAVGLMATLAANTTEVRHDEQAESSHRPARFGDRAQGGGGAVLPTGLFGYLGEEEEKVEEKEVVESAHTSSLTTGHAGQEQGTLLPAGLLGFLGGVEEGEAAPRVGQSCETSRQHQEGRQHEPIMLRERMQAGNDRVGHRESAAGWWMAEEKGSYVAAAGFSRIESKPRDERFSGEVCSGRTIGATADQGMRAEATGLEGRAMRAEGRVDMFDHRLEVGVGEHLWTKDDKTCEDVAVGMRQEQLVLQNMDGMASHTLEAKAEGKGPPLRPPMKRVQMLNSILDNSPSGTAAGKGPSAARARDSSIASMALEAKTEVKGEELKPVQGLQAFSRGVRAEGEALPCIPEGRSATVAAGGLLSTAGPGDGPLIRAPSVGQTDRADEQTRQSALTSLSRQVGQGWRQRGSIRRLFLANLAEVCASGQVQSFAVNALKTADMPMVLAQPLGYGSFGRVDDVSYASLPGQSFAMKTVTQAASMSARFCALVEMTVFARLVVDLARGAHHMHSMGLVHRDIKPGNVLVFESEEHGLHAKLADFGFAAEIGERCPGGMGTSGAMAFETMSADPVLGAPAQDVVSVAVVLLMVCLKRERRCSNLFTQQLGYFAARQRVHRTCVGTRQELRTADETARLEVLLERTRLGQDVSHETKLLEFEVSRRTMADGSFVAWLSPDKFDLTLESSEKLVGVLPSLLAVDPESREDMDFLVQFTSHLAELNKGSEQPVEEPGRGG